MQRQAGAPSETACAGIDVDHGIGVPVKLRGRREAEGWSRGPGCWRPRDLGSFSHQRLGGSRLAIVRFIRARAILGSNLARRRKRGEKERSRRGRRRGGEGKKGSSKQARKTRGRKTPDGLSRRDSHASVIIGIAASPGHQRQPVLALPPAVASGSLFSEATPLPAIVGINHLSGIILGGG
jgi:hypothetical protein